MVNEWEVLEETDGYTVHMMQVPNREPVHITLRLVRTTSPQPETAGGE